MALTVLSNGITTDTVEVPDTPDFLTPQQWSELSQAVDPLEQCDDLSISLYLMTRAFMSACM